MSAPNTASSPNEQIEHIDERALDAWVQQKGIRPRLSPSLLPRAALMEDAIKQTPVVWLTAPAGFGKSLIMSQVAEQADQRAHVLWFTCDHLDNPDSVLLEHLLIASSQQITEFDNDALKLLQRSGGQYETDKVLLLWLRDLGLLGQPILFFIDNLHALTDDRSWHLIQCLVRYRPDNLQLILAGRYRPYHLGQLQLDSSVQMVDIEKLRLRNHELEQWFEQQDIRCSLEVKQQLHQRFEGWLAGLSLWCHCYRAAGQPKDVPRDLARDEISDYLQGEILCQLSPPVQLFLKKMAVLGSASEALMASVLGKDYYQHLSLALHQQTFIEPSSERHGWYRIPSTMADCLMQLMSEEDRQVLHREAYFWLSQHQEPVAALSHACRVNSDREQVAKWVEQEAENILAHLDMDGLVVWFDQLGDELLFQSPRLMQIAAWAWLLTHQSRRAEAIIERLEQLNTLAPYEMAAMAAHVAVLKGNLVKAERLCQQSLDEMPSHRFTLRILLCSTLSHINLASKDIDNARWWNRQSQDLARKFRAPAMEALSFYDHARIEFNRGHIQRGLTIIDQGLELLEKRPDDIELLPRGRLLLYRCLFMWLSASDLERFDDTLQRGIDIATRAHDINVCYGYAVAALQRTTQHRFNEALDTLDTAVQQMQRWGVEQTSYQWLHIVRANVWISQGKLTRAQQCIDRLLQGNSVLGIPQPELFPMLPGFTLATQARIYLLSHKYDDCLQITEQWLKQNYEGLMTAYVRVVRAAAFALNQQPAESQHQFAIARKALDNEGIGLKFQQMVPDLAKLLGASDPSSVKELPNHVHLSDREQEVLDHMAQGHSNQEIADLLYISLHTVKTHARKINVKLGAKSRTQAIHRAKELMLI